jgi:drug/metabolite transporter (DMT)-like permease
VNRAILLGLVTFFGWGTGDLFTIVATRKIGATLATFWIFFFGFLLSAILLPVAPHDLTGITLPLLALNIFLGILYVSGNVLVSEAFRLSSAPLVGIIVQAFPAVVLLLSHFVFGDIITPIQSVFIVVIFTGVILCSVDFKSLMASQKLFDKGTLIALLAMVFLSIYFTFSRIPINAYGWYLPNLISTACFPIIILFIRKRKEKMAMPGEFKILFSAFMVGFLIRAGDFALNYGLSLPNSSSVVAPIASASPILFAILSYLIFKDKLNRQQVAGIITTLAGIISLAVFAA